MRTFSGNSVGDTATYSCNTGFELIGDSTTMCTQIEANSAEFPVVPPPECRREYCMNITELFACLLSCAICTKYNSPTNALQDRLMQIHVHDVYIYILVGL